MIVGEILRGKSLGRALSLEQSSDVRLAGHGVDLGAGSGSASYFRYFTQDESTEIVHTDLEPKEDVQQVDLSGTFPFATGSQDFLLLMNVLEHLYDYRSCLSECHRVLNDGGRLIGVVPFLQKVHPSPDDHFRYTESTLTRIFEEVGFRKSRITPLGYGPFTAATSQIAPLLKLRVLIAALTLFAIGVDKLLRRAFSNHPRVRADHFPLAYFFVAEK